MKRKNITASIKALDDVSEIKGLKFAYVVLKNRKKLELQITEDQEIFAKILEASEGYRMFEQKRLSLCELYSLKDENNKPITENDQYKIDNMEKFNEELNILTEEYKDDIEKRQSQIQEYNKLMEEDLEITFNKVTFLELPLELSEKQLRSLDFMIELD